MKNKPRLTTDHGVIRRWLESRGGIPAVLTGREAPTEDEGVLRVYFDKAEMPQNVMAVSWNDFFSKFDQSHLAFLYDDTTMGVADKYFKFISRDGE